jgi:hypothetical protein
VAACKEVGPPGFHIYIPPKQYTGDSAIITGKTDTSVLQAKMVLLEEMTGVKCVNCPKGQSLADKLADTTFAGQLAVVAVHGAHFLTTPYPGDSNYDNTAADAIDAYLGGSISKPSAAIDRVTDAGSGNRFFGTQTWQSQVQTRLAIANPVNIYLIKSFTGSTGHLAAKLFVKSNANDTVTRHLHLLLIENNLISTQSDNTSATGKDLNYAHQNVLRSILSQNGVSGDAIKWSGKKGALYTQHYAFDLPKSYNPDNCRLVAFVTGTAGNSYEVVQAYTTILK